MQVLDQLATRLESHPPAALAFAVSRTAIAGHFSGGFCPVQVS